MGHKEDMALRVIWTWVCCSTLFLFMGAPVRGQGFYTRTDELSCGGAKVQAVSRCVANPQPFPACTDQHFLFLDQTTGATIRVKASGEPVAETDYNKGKKRLVNTWLWGLARNWACLKGNAGSYVVVAYTKGGTCDTCFWYEVFDARGKKVATDREARTDKDIKEFKAKWDALGLPEPWPTNAFVDIKVSQWDK